MKSLNIRVYTPFEDEVIKKLYHRYDHAVIAKVLRRSAGGIKNRVQKLGIPKKRFPLSDQQVRDVEVLILKETPIDEIQYAYDINRYIIYSIRDRLYYAMSKNKPLYIESIKSFTAMGESCEYWRNEEQIMFSLDPEYSVDDLKGWELEEYKRIIGKIYQTIK